MSRAVILKEDNEQILPVTDIALVQGMSAALSAKQDTDADLTAAEIVELKNKLNNK